MAGVYFSFFQGIMSLIGFLGGREVFGWVEAYTPWITFILLLLIGCKMIYESISGNLVKDVENSIEKILR